MITHASERALSWKNRAQDDYEAFMERLSVKGRAMLTKHDELCSSSALDGHGDLWKRLAGGLSRLAPHASETEGRLSVRFYIRDGKYRQQVFALEDTGEGAISLSMPDVLDRAKERKILSGGSNPPMYKVAGDSEAQVQLEIINAATSDLNACKSMVSWGKRALRTVVTVNSKEKSLRTVELLCELAAEAWPIEDAAGQGQPAV